MHDAGFKTMFSHRPRADLLIPLEFQRRPEQRMASRTTINNLLAADYIAKDDEKHGRKKRAVVVRSLVLHHGDRPWNAPTRAADLFQGSTADTYQVVSRKPPGGSPAVPLDLPEMVLRLGPDWTAEDMRSELPEIRRVVEQCGDKDFDHFMAETLAEMLELAGYESVELKEAKTMEAVATSYGRGWDKVARIEREQGREEGQARLLRELAARKFGPETAKELAGLLRRLSDPDNVTRVAGAILECDSGEDFLARVQKF